MRTLNISNYLNLSKFEKVAFFSLFLILSLLIINSNIYFIADKMGITLSTKMYRDIVDAVSAGGSIAGAFSLIVGVTLPGWLVVAAAGFGLTSA
ncbi:Bacteriocin class IIc cyclic gassericin A-like [[Clostridium] sordellii]|uniref:class IIc cyclic bacteriocin n=1 Tax=Paraclostridium sordellii TaxID=1505 RepID=UPI0005E73AAE|nr:class IIc cyclic bacteriocin [Paeniclostridium sordellii]CEN23659.1 Bacteriocin class IIc cyclic gassericin A-like [[Clostridium] sordellii] [Paeniclostridium sordellii]CEP44030.1 Bacteriocin class IIc cyclic gassericin A-like [[Clostridium] sordellii] [Paeniclostridium sordellii]